MLSPNDLLDAVLLRPGSSGGVKVSWTAWVAHATPPKRRTRWSISVCFDPIVPFLPSASGDKHFLFCCLHSHRCWLKVQLQLGGEGTLGNVPAFQWHIKLPSSHMELPRWQRQLSPAQSSVNTLNPCCTSHMAWGKGLFFSNSVEGIILLASSQGC